MNRELTNCIRWLMDECIPPIIRDSKWFMYPFFWITYRGKNIKTAMEFKKRVYAWTPEEYRDFYSGLDTISTNRRTDLNEASIRLMLDRADPSATSLLDVGCGKGYFLERAETLGIELTGCDLVDELAFSHADLVQGFAENLPFEDNAFDIVTCSHTLEHILNENAAARELVRVAKKQVMVTVPCQRYFYYTLDEHVNFYPFAEKLSALFGLSDYTCDKVQGDWVFICRIP